MSRLFVVTSMTVDGLADVRDWFVAEGEHDRAALDAFGTVRLHLVDATPYDSGVVRLRYEPARG